MPLGCRLPSPGACSLQTHSRPPSRWPCESGERQDAPFPRRTSCLFRFLLFWISAAQGQIAGELKGRVSDPSGNGIANAQVRLTETSTTIQQNTIATGSGDYVFINLKPGSYSLEVSARGFGRLARTGITIATGQTVTANLVLHVGSEQQSVTVTADAPLLQSSTSDISTNIPRPVIAAMPLNTRNFVQLATLAPGVELPPGTVLPRINGGRPRTNEYLYDGISALQPEPGQVVYFPILDDIQEFTVQTNNVPAQFGRFNGGVVNVATRAGSNGFHGSVYEYFRNEALNARNYFSTTGQKPEYRRNLFGAALGGPILHNRLFFFGDYQGVRQLIGVTRISTIPTVNERNGIFTGVSKIFNPATTTIVNGQNVRQEFPNDVINVPFDPAAQALLARFPTPTKLTASANNYTRTANDDDHQNQFDVRVDGAFKSRDRSFGRYSYYNEVEQPVTPLPDGSGAITGAVIGTGGVAGLSSVLGQQAVFNETHTFSPRLLNDFRLGYTRRGNTITGATLGDTASSALGIPGIPTNAAFNNALPLFTFTGFQQLGPSPSTFSQYQTSVWEAVDSVVFTKGRHALTAGFDLRWYQLNAVAPPNPTGAFAFTTTGTNQQGVTNSGNAIASFLLGQVDTFQIDLQENKIRPRDHIDEFFVQDNWKVTDRLTANIGARWTLHFPSTEKDNQGAVFNLSTQELDYLGVDGNSRSARELHFDNVAPRIGFAYQVTPKTVVRSGYGIVFIDQSGITTPFTTPQFPFIQNVQQKTLDSVNAAFELSGGPSVAPIPFTPDAGLGQSVYTAKKTAGSGYSQQWNLAVAARDHKQSVSRIRLRWFAHRSRRHSRFESQSVDSRPTRSGDAAAGEGAQSLLRATAYLQLDWRQNDYGGAAFEAVSALPQHCHLPEQQRSIELQRRRGTGGSAILTRVVADVRLHALKADRRCVLGLLDNGAVVSEFEQPDCGRHISPNPGARCLERRYAERDFVQRHLRPAHGSRSFIRLPRFRQCAARGLAGEHDAAAAIGHAGHRDPGNEQQFLCRVCTAASEPCGQAKLVPGRTLACTLYQHRCVYHCSAIHYRNRVPQPRARTGLS